MPLVLNTPIVSKRATWAGKASDTLEIALLNNLGDAGLKTGERQIIDLLAEASGEWTVRLRFFSLPRIARGPQARARMAGHYTDFAELMRSRVDGLIVTGCEPRANLLPDESFWQGLTEVIDWAEHNTRSTIWSCLAAHAAVLHLDGIHRQPLDRKCSGLFAVDKVIDHPLVAGLRRPLLVPHSRHNDLCEDEIVAAGYQIVTRSPEIGVDLFVKAWRSTFVYLQGHPEYDGGALHREYRRDVGRYLDRTTMHYPRMPEHYFSADRERDLMAFELRARQARDLDLMASFPALAEPRASRRGFAQGLFRNWLASIHRAVASQGG